MNSSYQAGTWKVGMKRQEFAHETVFGIRIIRSPAKRENGINRRKSGILSIVLPGFFYFQFYQFYFCAALAL